MKDSRSNLSDLVVLDLDDCFLEFFDSPRLEVKLALMLFGHAVCVAEHQVTLALVAEQSHLLLALETSLTIFLHWFLLSLRSLFLLDHRSDFLHFGCFRLSYDFGLFLLSSLDAGGLLVARRAHPVRILGAVESTTNLAEGALGAFSC